MGLVDWLRGWFGGRRAQFGVDELARRLDVPLAELQALEPQYREFALVKRGGGQRRIYAPRADLKRIQRLVLRRVLSRLKAHPAATAYERGESIVTHARRHQGQELVVQFDLREFFPSTGARRVAEFFLHLGWDRPATALLLKICTWHDGLPQGAPTSPRLSNLVNHRLDARLAGLTEKLGGTYSRYADDLTFSFPARGNRTPTVRQLFWFVKQIVADEGYHLHRRKKVRVRRRHHRQLVAGLVVNERVNLPREVRRWLRAVEHRAAAANTLVGPPRPAPTLTSEGLAGWRSLQSMIERQRGGE